MKKKNFSRRDFLRGASVLTVGSVLAACSSTPAPEAPQEAPAAASQDSAASQDAGKEEPAQAPPADQISLRFVTNHGSSDVPLFEKVVQNFMDNNPNISIEYLDIAGDEFYDSINTQGVSGELPDIWYTRTYDIPVYASKGWTVNLQPLVEQDAAEVNVDDFWPAEVAQMKWQGDLYALPYDFSNIGIYYNKNLFDEMGVDYPPNDTWQWPELVELGLKFVEKGDGDQFTKWGLQFYTWDWVVMGLLFGWGGQVFTEDLSKCIINSPENAECLQFFVDSRKQGLYPEAGAAPAGVDPFAADMMPMSFQGSWATTYMREQIGDKFDFDCTVMPLSPQGKNCLNAAGGAWGIAANTKDLNAAWTFNKHLTSTESTNILISEPLRSIPGRKSSVPAWEQKAAEGGLPPKNVAAFATQMAGANAAPFPPYWRDFSNTWTNMIVPLLDGTISDDPAAVLAAFEDEVNRLIELG